MQDLVTQFVNVKRKKILKFSSIRQMVEEFFILETLLVLYPKPSFLNFDIMLKNEGARSISILFSTGMQNLSFNYSTKALNETFPLTFINVYPNGILKSFLMANCFHLDSFIGSGEVKRLIFKIYYCACGFQFSFFKQQSIHKLDI